MADSPDLRSIARDDLYLLCLASGRLDEARRTADARATLHTILAELNAQQLRLVTLDVLHDLSVITPPDDPEAERIAEEALSIAQDASALWFEARAMLDLAFVRRSRATPAQPLITEAEAILDSYGDPITLQQFRERVPSA